MSASRKLVIALITCVPILVILVWGGIYIARQIDRLLNDMGPILTQELAARLDREVRVGKVRVKPFGVAVLEDVSIAEGKRLADGAILSARRVTIRYDVNALVTQSAGAQSIKTVDITEPRINLVRRKDGTFNVQDLLKPPPGPPGRPFKGTIRITGGTATFKDFFAHTNALPVITHIHDVEGFVDARKCPIYSFRVSANGQNGAFGRAITAGFYDSRTKSVGLDVTATDVSAPRLKDYLGVTDKLEVLGGTLRIAAGIDLRRVDGRYKTTISGAMRVTNAIVRMPWFSEPIRQVNGSIALVRNRAALSLQTPLAGSQARLKGTITSFENPVLDMSITSPNPDYTRLSRLVEMPEAVRQVSISGRGPIDVRVSGKASDPLVEVTARVPSVSASGYDARDVMLSAAYRAGSVELRSARFNFARGSWTLNGTLTNAGKGAIDLEADVRNLDLSALRLPLGPQPYGIANARFAVSGTVANPTFATEAKITNGSLGGVAFASASARVRYASGKTQIQHLTVSGIAGGSIRARGEAARGNVNLFVIAEAIDFESVSRMLGIERYQGIGYFRGWVTGPIRNPTVSGVAEVFKGRFRDYEADYAQIAFSGSRRSVRITDGVIRLFPAGLSFTGNADILDTGRIGFQLTGRVERLTVERLSNLLGRKIEASGTIVGDFKASGTYLPNAGPNQIPLTHTVASADFRLEDGSVFGYPVTSAVAKAELKNDRLVVTEARAVSQDAELTFDGSASLKTREVNARFAASNFDLARLGDRIGGYVLVGGIAKADGTVTSVWNNPTISFGGGVDGFVINGKKFDEASYALVYSGGMLSTFQAALKRANQSYEVSGTGYNLQTNCVESATARILNGSVREMWDMLLASPYLASEDTRQLRAALRRIPRLTTGLVDGSVQINGCMSKPDGIIGLHAVNVGVDIQQIESIDLDASISSGVVSVTQLRALSGNTNITAIGDILLEERRMHLDVTALNVDLAQLRPWLGERMPGGTLAADLVIDGNFTAPHVIGSIEVVDPSYGTLKFDRLRASRIEVADNRIDFSDVILATGNHQAHASGYLPWDWADLTIPTGQPFEMTASLNKQDISLLGTFSTEIDASKTTGALEAMLQATGTISQPRLTGSLTVENGTVAMRNFINEFTDVNVDLKFDGNRVVIAQMSAASSQGGRVHVVPGGYVTVSDLAKGKVNLFIVANGMTVGERNLLGFGESIDMRIDAGLSVTGSLSRPVVENADMEGVRGGVAISDARLVFAIPENLPKPESRTYPIDPAFNITIRLGKDVWIAPPSMSLLAEGDGSLTGTLSKPDLQLGVEIEEGNLRLAASRLRIVPGGTIKARYSPPEEPELGVDFQAITTVTALSPFGRRERYRITLAASGPVANLQIGLTSTPSGLSREQMLAALGHVEGILASGETEMQKELVTVLTAVGSSTFFAPIETLFVERLGFEQFTLEYTGTAPLSLFLSKRLFGNLYVTYFQRLTSNLADVQDKVYELGISYRWKNMYEFTFGVDDQQTTTAEIRVMKTFN